MWPNSAFQTQTPIQMEPPMPAQYTGPTLPSLDELLINLSPGVPKEEPDFESELEEEYDPSEDEEYMADES